MRRNGRCLAGRASFIVTLLAIAGAVGASPTSAAGHTPFDTNLVKNPGAEAGAGTDGNHTVLIPNWVTGGSAFTVVRYGAAGFPTKGESARIHGGSKFFSCGQDTVSDAGSQTIALNGRTTLIANGHVKVKLSARIAGYDSQLDEGLVLLLFYQDGQEIGSIQTGAVSASDSLFVLKRASGVVPPGTNSMKVELYGQSDTSNGGTYCDAYFDNISVVLKLV